MFIRCRSEARTCCFALVVCEQIDAEEGQGSLVGRVHDVRSEDVAFASIDLDFAGEVSELAEAD